MTPSDEVGVAGWIRDALHPFARDVGSVIPVGFEGYARIFHPAWRPGATRLDGEGEVRWSEVAAASGRTVHPEMQFHSIAGPMPGPTRPDWFQEPRMGVLSSRQAAALIPLLTGATSTPGRCWFCLWDGYGYLHGGTATYAFWAVKDGQQPPSRPPARRPPAPKLATSRIRLPYREYLLFTGSVEQGAGWEDGPNLWWPNDRAWCVASEIDFPYTYVGGPARLVASILADPFLEAMPATLSDGITADSDRINS